MSYMSYNVNNTNMANQRTDRNNGIVLPVIRGESRENMSNFKRPELLDKRSNTYSVTEGNDFFLQEINNLKRVLNKVLENQGDLQSRMTGYNNLISDQENIIRLNNIKLNEHDSKLTEILFTFNNYLNLNDKSTKMLNDLTLKYEDCVKRNDYNEFKTNIYTLNKHNEIKISENLAKIEELQMKTNELSREQDTFQKYTLEKLKLYKDENIEYRFQQQQQIIKLEEAKEIKLNQHFEQIRGIIKLLEKTISDETMFRKAMIENTKLDLLQLYNKTEEKLQILEKNALETEHKIINYSKDYVTTFQELIQQYNQKFDIDIKSLQTVLTSSYSKIDEKIDDNRKMIDSYVHDFRVFSGEMRNNYGNLEVTIKDALENHDDKLKGEDNRIDNLETKVNTISISFESFVKENLIMMERKIETSEKGLSDKYNERLKLIDDEFKLLSSKIDKIIEDNNQQIDLINKQFKDIKNNLIENFNIKLKEFELEGGVIEKKMNDKLEAVKVELEEYEKKLILMMNLHIDSFKFKLNNEQKELTQSLSDKLEEKLGVLRSDFEKNKKEDQNIIDGRLQTYVLESEERINKNIDERLKKVKDEVENVTVKLASVLKA
jgi:hypothetical protein